MIRHGESEWNALRKWQGQADPPLTDLGRTQAFHAAQKLGTFDVIASSDLQRARDTAQIIASHLGAEVHFAHEDFRETDCGEWQGLTHDEIARDYPGWLEAGRKPEGFERDEDVVTRVVRGMGRIAALAPGGNALVVAHGGIIRVMRRALDVHDQRIPNLGGCEFVLHTGGGSGSSRIEVGDIIELVNHGEIGEEL